MKIKIRVHEDKDGKLQPSCYVSATTPTHTDRNGQRWATVNVRPRGGCRAALEHGVMN